MPTRIRLTPGYQPSGLKVTAHHVIQLGGRLSVQFSDMPTTGNPVIVYAGSDDAVVASSRGTELALVFSHYLFPQKSLFLIFTIRPSG